MSHYATSRVLWEVARDGSLAELLRTDPAAVLDSRDLESKERKALAAGDIRALFELGAHPFLLYHFALRLAGGWSLPFMQDYLGKLQGLSVGDLET